MFFSLSFSLSPDLRFCQIQMILPKTWECSACCKDVSVGKQCSKKEESRQSPHGNATGCSCGLPTSFIIQQSLSKGKYTCSVPEGYEYVNLIPDSLHLFSSAKLWNTYLLPMHETVNVSGTILTLGIEEVTAVT
jgi:hypothetical protein